MVIKQKNASLARRARMHELQRGMIDHDEAMWFLCFPMVFQWFLDVFGLDVGGLVSGFPMVFQWFFNGFWMFLDVFGLDVGGCWRFHHVFHDVSMSHTTKP